MKMGLRKQFVLAALQRFEHGRLCVEPRIEFATQGNRAGLCCFRCNKVIELPDGEDPEKWREAAVEVLRR